MVLADAAAFLCRQWPVFPCGTNKRPITVHGFKDAATNPEEARRLFALPGAALIGVPTGPGSDLCVVDLDIKESGSGLDWLEANGWRIPRTRRHRTRSGGIHLLFRYPVGRMIRNSVRKLAPGVDVRAIGGYIIVPPSDGYSITEDSMPAEMPDWILELLDPPLPPAPEPPPAYAPRPESYRTGEGTPYGLAALAAECSSIRGAVHGVKHYTLNRAAYAIGGLVAAREVGESYAFRALEDALRDLHARQPCEDLRHAEKTLERGFRDGIAAPRQPPPDRPRPPPYSNGTPPHDAPRPEEAPPGPEEVPPPPPGAQPLREPEETADPLWVDAGGWEEAEIPPRPWLAPGLLLRGAVTLAAGPPGGGKSSLMIAWAIAGALNREHGPFRPVGHLRIVSYNVEDDQTEQRRRLSAALRQYGGRPGDLEGRVIRTGPTHIGTLIAQDPQTGRWTLTAAWERLEAMLEETAADVLIADPLAELHTSEESDNTAMRHVVAAFRALAIRRNIAVVIIHHTRKGAAAGEVDSIRGAGAIVGAARIALTIVSMTEEEAEELELPASFARSFFRLDNVKANYSPKRKEDWCELVEYELANGEAVAAAVPWAATGGTGAVERNALIAAAVERGTPTGPYSPRLTTEEPRSVAPLLAQHGIRDTDAQREAVRRLLASGFTVAEYTDVYRKVRRGLRAASGLPSAKWNLAE